MAPSGEDGMAGEHFAKDDAVAAEKHPADGLQSDIAITRFAGGEQGPAAGAVARARGTAAAVAGAALGIDERAQVVEAVGGEQASGGQLPKSGLHLGLLLAR